MQYIVHWTVITLYQLRCESSQKKNEYSIGRMLQNRNSQLNSRISDLNLITLFCLNTQLYFLKESKNNHSNEMSIMFKENLIKFLNNYHLIHRTVPHVLLLLNMYFIKKELWKYYIKAQMLIASMIMYLELT